MEVLRVKNISKSIKNKQIINEISFNISEGQIVGLLGPNGAGKTTTFYSILGLIRIDSGEVFLDDKNITMIPPHKRAEVGMSYLPQEPSIFRNLSVKSNILGVAERNFLKKEDLINFYQNTIKEFGLESIEDSMGYVLSGGQRRKVEIARTLISDPKMILLDEPFAGIDPIAIQEIKKVLNTLKNKGIGILITDHNVRETLEICDHAAIINNGEIIAHGTKENLISNQVVKDVYLGNMYN